MLLNHAPYCSQSLPHNYCVNCCVGYNFGIPLLICQMAQWLERASRGHEMYYYDLEVMNSNPGWVEFEMCGTSVLVVLDPKIT